MLNSTLQKIYRKFTGLPAPRRSMLKRHHKGFFMFHKNLLPSSTQTTLQAPQTLHLVSTTGLPQRPIPTAFFDLVAITSRRCSSFFAEAAVLVLVFGILDYFMLKGRIELPWIVGALAISLGLLAASIATDFGAQRWIKSHP